MLTLVFTQHFLLQQVSSASRLGIPPFTGIWKDKRERNGKVLKKKKIIYSSLQFAYVDGSEIGAGKRSLTRRRISTRILVLRASQGEKKVTFWNAYCCPEIRLVKLLQGDLLQCHPLELVQQEEVGGL